ncbi:hypothetical protein [Bosea sp. 117]|uniref:hypothetical protein n=1 Tax=Bosea sp. 117 TaxID=1125973 RepID=UPI000494167A|nr:hypothetical protein [Bosea sp. 117]
MKHEPPTLCAECLRCGQRSILGRALPQLAGGAMPEGGRLRCDLCGGRRVRLVPARGPAEIIAFVARRR